MKRGSQFGAQRRNRSRLYDNLIPGLGGIARGVFDKSNDSVNPFSFHYCAADYIVGQWYYIQGD